MFFKSVFFRNAALLLLLAVSFLTVAAPPKNFTEAKITAKEKVYFDKKGGTIYCGCDYNWQGKSGGEIDLKSCGYEVRKQPKRASVLEWEHIVPAHNFGHFLQCWQKGGGRKNCKNDVVYNLMEGDLFNLAPSIGEVNGDRSNFNFGQLAGENQSYGQCQSKVNFKERTFEPRDEVKGMVARVYFYMYDRYDIQMSDSQTQLLMAWDKLYPVSEWEQERDNRIAAVMGYHNPFVTGEKKWSRNHKNSGEGRNAKNTQLSKQATQKSAPQTTQQASSSASKQKIIGNKNSKIYHLAEGCPGYSTVKEVNRVYFETENSALKQGYTKAKNCKN